MSDIPKPKVGRPSIRSPELARNICELLASGFSLRKICSQDGFPSFVSVFAWLNDDPDFLKQYNRAREIQADYFADEIVEVADNEPDPKRAQVMVNSRIWATSKLNLKKYGNQSGAGVTINNMVLVVPEPKRAELIERRRNLQPQIEA